MSTVGRATARNRLETPQFLVRVSMSNLCSDSVLTGQEGTILFTPPGTSVCVRDCSVCDDQQPYLLAVRRLCRWRQGELTEEDGGNLDGGITDGKEETVSAVGTGASGDQNAAGDDMEGVPFIVDGITIAGDGGVPLLVFSPPAEWAP